jgi:hypothetical protein
MLRSVFSLLGFSSLSRSASPKSRKRFDRCLEYRVARKC